MITSAQRAFQVLDTSTVPIDRAAGLIGRGGGGGGSGSLSSGLVKSTPVVSVENSDRQASPPVFFDNTYAEKSSYVKRQVSLIFSNIKNEHYVVENAKMQITGSKWIGIQQDEFVIRLYNINFAAFAKSINQGYKFITVKLGNDIVFRGTIKTINTGRENIIERALELKCLMKVTDLLSDMVSPITVNSSMNIWAVLTQVTGQGMTQGTVPDVVRSIRFPESKTFTGYRKTVIDDMIAMINNELNRTNNKTLPWVDYTMTQDGVINLFGASTITEILNMQPYTGLTDTPSISEDSVTFNSIYKTKLIPGRVVYIKNEYFTTIGGETAFVYGWDPNGFYVVTEVRYDLSNYPNKFVASCKARPLSKYNNFTASLRG